MLIILYGDFSKSKNQKQQAMIDGRATCGYREYARKFGHIVYLSPQDVSLPWEHSITKAKNVLKFISKYPKSIIWSVKHSSSKDEMILSKIKNKKVYYSCNSKNMYNKYCDISLVDTPKRVKKNGRLWFKGKDPDYWMPKKPKKEYDYLLIGKRADKNEIYFLRRLNDIQEKRRILWIGGKKHKKRAKSKHDLVCTEFITQEKVKDLIPMAKVGVLFTELKVEGFPQTFLEMTMCGVPVVYNEKGPGNKFYFHNDNCILCSKGELINSAEKLLKIFDAVKCRRTAIQNYSIDKSYKRMRKCLKL
ncbi:MAG: glycosyltransferase [Candidatus Helarchaeota archaeon]